MWTADAHGGPRSANLAEQGVGSFHGTAALTSPQFAFVFVTSFLSLLRRCTIIGGLNSEKITIKVSVCPTHLICASPRNSSDMLR